MAHFNLLLCVQDICGKLWDLLLTIIMSPHFPYIGAQSCVLGHEPQQKMTIPYMRVNSIHARALIKLERDFYDFHDAAMMAVR